MQTQGDQQSSLTVLKPVVLLQMDTFSHADFIFVTRTEDPLSNRILAIRRLHRPAQSKIDLREKLIILRQKYKKCTVQVLQQAVCTVVHNEYDLV